MADDRDRIHTMDRLIKDILPEVRTTKGDVEEFDANKIIDSLILETGIPVHVAEQVTQMVLKRILTSNIRWLSGPAIREMCCSVLAEIGLLQARKRYTRLGMPLMDYEKFLTAGIKENANQYRNPESIHNWAADRISSEYALLRILREEQANAHLNGDLHVHMLRYFDLRPFCQEFDLRMILKFGLPPVNWPYSAVSKPAKHPIVAMLHAAKWLGLITGEFSGGLGYDNFTVFLAPYVRGLPEKEIEQLAQCFIFESNQIYASRGAQIPFTSITCVPTIPDSLLDVPAIGPEGKVSGIYGDYVDECNKLFRAIAKVYYQGDGNGRLFNFPKHEIKLKKEWFDKFEDDYLLVSKEAAKFGTPYFLNLAASWMPDEVHSQCCRIILTPEGLRKTCDDPSLFDWHTSYLNLGSLQSVSLNLPRYAYQSRGNDDKLFDLIVHNMNLAKEILLIKRDLIGKRLENELLPLCSRKLADAGDAPLLDLRKQSVNIGFVGLNECVLSHVGEELHASKQALEFGLKIVQFMADKCKQFSDDHGIKFSLWEQPAESASMRFALLDMKHYPDLARVQGDLQSRSIYYTNSDHLRYSADIDLFQRISDQARFHPIVQGGVITHIWLGESNPGPEGLWKFTKRISCLKCGRFISGIFTKCPHCGALDDKIEWWSRITGYYARINSFNPGKVQEFHERKRYDLAML
ncbi:MAG: anaerobic ribonucleoside-triphosphate reductase [Candidatus Helarchaeota archaeon]